MISLEELYKLQKQLDDLIEHKKDIELNKKELLTKRLLALAVEVSELANATKCFKYWSNKNAETRERILDEYADVLHFFLSVGLTLGFTPDEIENGYKRKYEINIERLNSGY